MRIHRTLVLGASLLMAFSTAAVGEASSPSPDTAQASPGALPSGPVGDGAIKIGANAFSESDVMAELYAQALEAAGQTVTRKLDIGPREVTWAAMQAGKDINIMPEYIGSLLETINNHAGEASGDADATRTALAARLAPLDMSVLARRPAWTPTRSWSRRTRPPSTRSRALERSGEGRRPAHLGPAPRVRRHATCAAGALLKYGIDISKLQVTELGPCGGEMATAIVNGGVQVGELCSTQADIAQNGPRRPHGRPGNAACRRHRAHGPKRPAAGAPDPGCRYLGHPGPGVGGHHHR